MIDVGYETGAGLLTTRELKVQELSSRQRRALFSVYESVFAGALEEVFNEDLNEKESIFIVEKSGVIVGFSTLKTYEHNHEGRHVRVLFSGDTVICKEAWGSMTMLRAWLKRALSLRRDHPDVPLYWLLLAGSYRTYRFLPIFFKSFFPNREVATPRGIGALIASLARIKFGEDFVPQRGVVVFPKSPYLKSGVADASSGRTKNLDTAFYLTLNPRYCVGEELVCLTEISVDNLTAAAFRLLR